MAAIAQSSGGHSFTAETADQLGAFEAARQAAPDCAMAHLGKAWILGNANDTVLAAKARPLLEAARALPLDPRAAGKILMDLARKARKNAGMNGLDLD